MGVRQNFAVVDFEEIEINGVSAMFTNDRIDRVTIPGNLYAYDIRSGESADGEEIPFGSIEPKVSVDHTGTIITAREIPMNEEGYAEVEDSNFLETTTFKDWLAKQPELNNPGHE